MAARSTKEIELATQRNYRKFTAQQKLEIVLAGLRGATVYGIRTLVKWLNL